MRIKYRITYSIVTPESAKDGEVAEHGWYANGLTHALQDEDGYHEKVSKQADLGDFDIVDDLHGLVDEAQSLGICFDGSADWAQSMDPYIDYETGEDTSYCLHVNNPRQSHWVMKALANN